MPMTGWRTVEESEVAATYGCSMTGEAAQGAEFTTGGATA